MRRGDVGLCPGFQGLPKVALGLQAGHMLDHHDLAILCDFTAHYRRRMVLVAILEMPLLFVIIDFLTEELLINFEESERSLEHSLKTSELKRAQSYTALKWQGRQT